MEGESDESRRETKEKRRKRLDVRMEIVDEQPDKFSPLVGYFPSGFNPLKYGKSNEAEPNVRVFRNIQRPNRLQLVVSPNGSKAEFVGTNYTGEVAAAQVCSYAVGVLDKDTQRLKIVPIASNKIFRMEPRVGGSDTFEEESPNMVQEYGLMSEMKADKIRDLTNLYGTKKSMTQASKLDSLLEKEDQNTQVDVDRKIEGAVINKEALESAVSYSARNIPPYDLIATTPEKAYPLDKIILKGEWKCLLDVLELSQSGSEITPDIYPSFVCNRVHKLWDIRDENEKRTLACIFSYITHLIKFKDQRSVDSASAKHHKIPGILHQKFLTMFADSETFRLSAEKHDLLISYVLVLTLFADKFETDLSDIAGDLRMTPVPLRQYYQHLGCEISRIGSLLLATLPVPLQFPQLRTQRRRR